MRQEWHAAGAVGGRSGRQLAAGAGDAGVPTKETNNQPMPVQLGLEALRRKRQRSMWRTHLSECTTAQWRSTAVQPMWAPSVDAAVAAGTWPSCSSLPSRPKRRFGTGLQRGHGCRVPHK